MQINIVAAGNKMPVWVTDPCADYLRRLPKEYKVTLVEIPLEKRSKSQSLETVKKRETQRLLDAVPENHFLVALDQHGQSVTTHSLSSKLLKWREAGQDVSFLIGGPDGIDFTVASMHNSASSRRAKWPDWQWSLSDLTLPHPLVRVMLVEQLYRAWSMLAGHPYHRE